MLHNDGEFRSFLNTNPNEISGLTIETSGAINSEISSQVSRQLEELKSDLNVLILEVINSAIAEKILPSIENAIRLTKTTLNTKWDLRSDGPYQSELGEATPKRNIRSDGPHQSQLGPATQKRDLRSDGLHQSELVQAPRKRDLRSGGLHPSKIGPMTQKCDLRSDMPPISKTSQMTQESQNDFPRLITTSSNCRENSLDCDQSDEDGYDIY